MTPWLQLGGLSRELGKDLVFVEGNANEARRLIKRGADVNYVYRFMRDGMGKTMTPLIQAVGLGDANVISVLIERGANVNKHEPMHWKHRFQCSSSTGSSHPQEADICLLDHGADVNAKNSTGGTVPQVLLSPMLLSKAISPLSISLSFVELIFTWLTLKESCTSDDGSSKGSS